ncbi:MAG: hypothetical protein JSS87_08285 [Acidobacteria bacterium]|nr:hypothetical protein [Acidobacteriota bacterium]
MIKASPISTGNQTVFATDGCTDQVVGDILSGWRYDISGLDPEMRVDYEQHFAECAHCRSKQRMHRTIDVALMVIFSLSTVVFLLATGMLHRMHLTHATLADVRVRNLSLVLTAQAAAVGGLLFSMLMWVLVAIATPAPRLISGTVRQVRSRNL